MKTNEDLQKDVQNAIKWEPLLNAAEIGVTAKDGIVTLTGTVDGYMKKSQAEDAAKSVVGVKAVVENIEIMYGNFDTKTDNEIAREALDSLKWNWQIPNDKIQIKVEDGWITLEGELEWNYQRDAAKKAVSNLFGVKGISNSLKIKSEIADKIEKDDIELAMSRNWSTNTQDIGVEVSENKVTLNGTVDSLYQKDEAERIAWKTPGVLLVDNDLIVDYD